jgi:hypothetical protein
MWVDALLLATGFFSGCLATWILLRLVLDDDTPRLTAARERLLRTSALLEDRSAQLMESRQRELRLAEELQESRFREETAAQATACAEDLRERLVHAEAALAAEKAKLPEQLVLLQEARQELEMHFRVVASEVFAEMLAQRQPRANVRELPKSTAAGAR